MSRIASLVSFVRRTRGRMVGMTALVSALYVANYGLTLLRERTVATTFGAGRELDVYYIALGVVTLIGAVPTRAVSGPLVPCLAAVGLRGPEQQARLANSILTVLAAMLVAAMAIVMLASPALVPLVAPGLTAEEQASLASLLRWLAPLVVCLGMYEVWRALLNAYFEFVTPLLAPLLNSLAIVAALLLLTPALQTTALVAGALVGALLQMALPALAWHVRHLRLKLAWDVHSKSFQQLLRLSGWSAILVLLGQLTLMVDRVIGSYLPPGNVTALNYAYKLVDASVAVLAISTSTVAFPSLSKLIAEGNRAAFWSSCKRGSLALGALAAAGTVVLVLFSEPIIRIVYGGGRFGEDAARLTAQALASYAFGLAPLAVGTYLGTALYAMLKMRLLVGLGMFALGVKAIVAIALLAPLAQQGVALAQSVAYGLTTALMALYLWWDSRQEHAVAEDG